MDPAGSEIFSWRSNLSSFSCSRRENTTQLASLLMFHSPVKKWSYRKKKKKLWDEKKKWRGKKTFHGWKNTSDGNDLRLLLTGNTGKTGSQSQAPSLWPLISSLVYLSSLSFSIYPFLSSLSSSLLSSSNPATEAGLLVRGLYVSTSLTPQLKPPHPPGHMTIGPAATVRNQRVWCGSHTSEAAHWGDPTSAQLSTGLLQAATENCSTSVRWFHSQFESILSDWSL